MVADALQRIAKAGPVEPPEVVPSPEVLGYRSRVSFTLRRLRGGRVVAGYHALGSPAHVVDVETCLLAAEPIPAVWRALRAGWGHGARLLPDGGRLRLTLRSADGGVELLVDGGVPGWDAGPLLEATDGLTAVWHRPDREGRGAAELVADTRGAGGGVAFEQVNRAAADLLRAHVRAEIERHAPEPGKAVDAYCGVGTYGRTLSREGWRVTGIELDPAAAVTAATDAPEGFDVVVGAVEDVLGRALPAELLIANPPRAGLGPDVTTIIGREPPDVVLYVSCDPGTLARDVAALSGSHHVAALTCFDLFPQTAHVETVAVLTRSSGEAR